MKCFECGTGTLQQRLTAIEHEVRGLKFLVEDLALECDSCGFQLIPPERLGEHGRKTDLAFRQAAGYMTASQIREARERLGMTQAEFAAHLGVGEASLKRWELGALPDRSCERLIRLLTDPVYTKQVLADLCRRLGVTSATEPVVRVVYVRVSSPRPAQTFWSNPLSRPPLASRARTPRQPILVA